MNGGDPSKYEGLEGILFYESHDDEGLLVIRRLDTGAVVAVEHKTLREVMRDYFTHPQWKAADPRGIGILERRHVVAVDHVYIGKETNEVREEEQTDSDGAVTYGDAQQYARYGLREAVKAHGVKAITQAIGEAGLTPIPERTLYRVAQGLAVKDTVIDLLLQALDACPLAWGCCNTDVSANVLTQSHSHNERVNTGTISEHNHYHNRSWG